MEQRGIGKYIKQHREEHQMMQSELAKLLNVSDGAISSWERDRTEPNIGQVKKMCEIFNCSMSELIMGEKQSTEVLVSDEELLFLEALRKSNSYSRMLAYKTLLENMKAGE